MSAEVFVLPTVVAYFCFFMAWLLPIYVAVAIPIVVLGLDIVFAILDLVENGKIKRFLIQMLIFCLVFLPMAVICWLR